MIIMSDSGSTYYDCFCTFLAVYMLHVHAICSCIAIHVKRDALYCIRFDNVSTENTFPILTNV